MTRIYEYIDKFMIGLRKENSIQFLPKLVNYINRKVLSIHKYKK
ncbi:MAG: hypothetical protein K0S30_1903 [Clostridia bacterium]|jgi:hypothetical protein|nr:hypothetical protein [Clostridia bacterium]